MVPEPAVSVAATAKDEAKPKKRSIFRYIGDTIAGVFALTVLLAMWVGAIGLPFVLVAAIASARWQTAGVLLAFFAAPHVLPAPPAIPGLRRITQYGFKSWFGPEGTVRFVDLSSVAAVEPEAEPGTAAERSEEKRKQMYLMHPHGILSLGVVALLNEKPDIRCLSSGYLYRYAPIFRWTCEGLLGWKMGSVSPGDLHGLMKKGDSPLMMVPGGFHEATIACAGHERVFLKNRKGFVKYALRYGYDLVPCYNIGEGDLFANPQGAWKPRFALNNIFIPAVLPFGWIFFPLFPRRGVELTTVVGPPVRMPHIKNPTREDVNEHHARYVAALKDLYSRAVPGTKSENRKLEVW